MELEPRARELLGRAILGQLGFLGLDGYPKVLPVWFQHVDREILVATPSNAYKCRALRAEPRAALTVATPEWPYLLVSVSGPVTIEILEEPRRIQFLNEIAFRYLGPDLGRRYMDRWMRGGSPGDGDLVRLHIEHVRYANVSGE
jgi:hypothetical protein